MALINAILGSRKADLLHNYDAAYMALKETGAVPLLGGLLDLLQDHETDFRDQAFANYLQDDGTDFGNKDLDRQARQPYRYHRLPESSDTPHVRLLKLRPRDNGGRILTSLRTYSLQDCPKYDALSYCWGTASADIAISCDGLDLDVTRTAASAISRLQLLGCRYLWIDAVCINQRDLDEREAQVRVMQRIYGQASRVWVWLGGESAREARGLLSKGAFQTLREFADNTQSHDRPLSHQPKSIKEEAGEQERREPDEIKHGLELLLKCPWFDRIWCVQEVAVASRVSIICGPDQISWSTFSQGLANITRQRKNCGQIFGAIQQESLIVRRLHGLASHEYPLHGEDSTSYLVRLLMKFRTRMASDPRDKVYGLLGLVKRSFGYCALEVSYRDTVAGVYRKTAAYVLKCGKSLSILEACALQRSDSTARELASWAPDWRQDASIPMPFTHRSSALATAFAAARKTQSNVSFQQDDRLLCLRGRVVDSLAKVAALLPLQEIKGGHIDLNEYTTSWYTLNSHVSTFRDLGELFGSDIDVRKMTRMVMDGKTPDVSDWSSQKLLDKFGLDDLNSRAVGQYIEDKLRVRPKWLEKQSGERVKSIIEPIKVFSEWSDVSERASRKQHYPTGESWNAAYWQTLAAGNFIRDYATTRDYFLKWHKSLSGMQSIASLEIEQWKTQFAGLAYMALPKDYMRWQEDQPFSELLKHAYNRRFARTAKGYYCLVPKGAEEGDLVAIMQGSDVPLIIRESGQEWELVGTAYVHGIMHGEAYNEEKSKQFWFR